jgi:hypothetical protein
MGETMEDLSLKTAKELREYAEENNINLGDAKTKTKILSKILNIESNIGEDMGLEKPENVITSPVSLNKSASTKAPEKMTPTKVAVYSEKNLRWNMIGTLTPGYNIVTKEEAEKWLTLNSVREATPEEVADHYGL